MDVEELKEIFKVKEDQELAALFGRSKSAVSIWRKSGIPAAIEKKAYELQEKEWKEGNMQGGFVKDVLLSLGDYVGTRGIRGFAAFLGIKETVLYSWIARNSIGDTGSIVKKIPTVRVEYLESGNGDMLQPAAATDTRPQILFIEQILSRKSDKELEGLIFDLLKSEQSEG